MDDVVSPSIQFQIHDRLIFKFVIASRSESLRSRVFCTSVSSSWLPLVPSCFVLASSAHQSPVAPAFSVFCDPPSVAPVTVVSTPIHAARWMSAAPAVSTHGGSQCCTVLAHLCSGLWPVPGAFCTVVFESAFLLGGIRGPGRRLSKSPAW